jgi:hypothetical protein
MNTVYAELVKRGKFAWQLLWTGQRDCPWKNSYGCLGGTGTTILVSKGDCAAKLRKFCQADSQAQTRAMMFPFAGKSTDVLPEFQQDLANFLLTRGPHAFLGHAWKGCSQQYLFPEALNADYGEPNGLCKETSEGSEVFTRDWTEATVQMSCKSYEAKITMKSTGKSVFGD